MLLLQPVVIVIPVVASGVVPTPSTSNAAPAAAVTWQVPDHVVRAQRVPVPPIVVAVVVWPVPSIQSGDAPADAAGPADHAATPVPLRAVRVDVAREVDPPTANVVVRAEVVTVRAVGVATVVPLSVAGSGKLNEINWNRISKFN